MMSKRGNLAWMILGVFVFASTASAEVLPASDGTKWLGVFTGASSLATGQLSNGDPSGMLPLSLTATFRLDGPLDNQGTPTLPAPYVVGSVGGDDFAIPTFASTGSELVGTIRNLQLCLIWDANPGIWRTVADLDGYASDFGDVLLFGDPGHLVNGVVGANGGQFDVLYNTSGIEFRASTMSPAAGYGGEHAVFDSSTGAFAGGASASDALIVGQFENLLANGVTQTRNLRFAGRDLATDATIPLHLGLSLAEYVLYAVDVLGPDEGVGDLQLDVGNFVANVEVVGGSLQHLVKKDGLQIQNVLGQNTGNTTDIRFSSLLSRMHFPGVDNLQFDDYQDVAAFQGSFTYVSVPESSSIVLGLAGAGLGVLSHRRRKRRRAT